MDTPPKLLKVCTLIGSFSCVENNYKQTSILSQAF